MRALAPTLLFVALACPACSGLPEYDARPVPLTEPLDWLRVGSTDAGEVRAHLGEPVQVHEDGRIELFDLTPKFERPARREPGLAPAYSLVLVYDAERRVQRASLVRLW